MPRIKQVLRCYVAGNGTRTISSLMDISRNTVKKYITTFNQSGKTIEEILAMDEPDLLRLFNEKPDPYPPQPKSDRYAELMDRMPEYARMLRKKGVTKTMVFQRYRKEHPDGYMKSQFFQIFQMNLLQFAPSSTWSIGPRIGCLRSLPKTRFHLNLRKRLLLLRRNSACHRPGYPE